eukprot:11643899-Alexandrium_andersonii.AAC.1
MAHWCPRIRIQTDSPRRAAARPWLKALRKEVPSSCAPLLSARRQLWGPRPGSVPGPPSAAGPVPSSALGSRP